MDWTGLSAASRYKVGARALLAAAIRGRGKKHWRLDSPRLSFEKGWETVVVALWHTED
jgi:hypothetical protein